MVLGSGLAWGQTTPQAGTGFRSTLKTLLSADGNRVTYVGAYPGSGSLSDSGFNNVVQASPNSTLADALARTGLLARDKPNLVLVAVGTEDVLYGAALADLPRFTRQIEALVAATWAQSRTSTVLLNLPPAADVSADARIHKANAAIAALVAAQQALSRKLVLADVYGNLTRVDISADGVWPSETGYATIAAVVVAALRDAASRGWLEDPLAVSSLATVVTTAALATGFVPPRATASLAASGRAWGANGTSVAQSARKPEETGARVTPTPTGSGASLESSAGAVVIEVSAVVVMLLVHLQSFL